MLLSAFIGLVALTWVFLWGESIRWGEMINDNKLSNFCVSVFTILGTIATIVLTIKQIQHNKKMQLATIEPDLVPKPITFSLHLGLEPASHCLESTFDVEIKNEGIGPAKRVMVQWVAYEFMLPGHKILNEVVSDDITFELLPHIGEESYHIKRIHLKASALTDFLHILDADSVTKF